MSAGNANNTFPSSNSTKVLSLLPPDVVASDEGSYFIATNPTPGTAIATTTSVVDDATGATTHAQQKPVMFIANPAGGASPGPMNIYLRYLKMITVQVPTSATSWKYAMRLTPNLGSKITTAGTVITPVSPNPNGSVKSRAQIQFGAITATDSSTDNGQILVANGQVSGAIPVALDEWLFNFGMTFASVDMIGTMTLVKRHTIPVPPIIIPPGWGMTLEMWGASNAAAPSWEFEMGWIERPQGQ